MNRTLPCRVFSVLLLLALLGSPVIASAPGQILPDPAPASLFAWFWQALGQIVPGIAESHAGMDPDGTPTTTGPGPGTASSESDSHAGMDPDGRP